MNFTANNIYHIYNRGNNKQTIFFSNRNYDYFIEKMKKQILPHADLLAYCLMPNHFHFLIHADTRTEVQIEKAINSSALSEGIRVLLSGYTRGVNREQKRSGNLIQQTTKSKCVLDGNQSTLPGFATTCFHYIHHNPVKAGLATRLEDWLYSSYREYAGLTNDTLCNHALAHQLLDVRLKPADHETILSEESIDNIW